MNNNLHEDSKGRCRCGRYMTIGENHARINGFLYECPDCEHDRYQQYRGHERNSREEYYKKFKNMFEEEKEEDEKV